MPKYRLVELLSTNKTSLTYWITIGYNPSRASRCNVEEHLYGFQTFHRSECGLDPGSIIQALKR